MKKRESNRPIWEKRSYQDILKILRDAADSVSLNEDYLSFKGLDVFIKQGSIEFRPLVGEKDSLIISNDVLSSVNIDYKDNRPHSMRICTEYGELVILLKDY